MTPEEIARQIVFDWWKTQDAIIPTRRNQDPLISAIAAAVAAEHQRTKKQCARVVIDSLSPELSSPATRLVVEQAAHAILALP